MYHPPILFGINCILNMSMSSMVGGDAEGGRGPPGGPPRVLLLDIDGTLVGKVNAAVCEYELTRIATGGKKKKNGSGQDNTKNNGAGTTSCKAAKDALVCRLRYGIIRPHVLAFCKHMQLTAENTELFIYTASDCEWAAFFVPCIEAALGVKFNRPVFSRKHCINIAPSGDSQPDYRKSIAKVAPAIYGRLRKKHGLKSVYDLNDSIVLIDNTPGVMLDTAENSKLVVCPTYAYTYWYDVLAFVDVNFLHRNFARTIPTLVRVGLFPSGVHVASYQQFATVFYSRLAKAMSENTASNTAILQRDTFWARLLQAMASPRARTLDAATVRNIGAAVHRQRPS